MILPTPEYDPLFAPLDVDGVPFREKMIRWIEENCGVDVSGEIRSAADPLERIAA